MPEKLELSADTILVKLYGGVTGVTRRAEDKGRTVDGRAVETQNLITTRQADAQEAEKAKKLLAKLRAIVDSYCSTVININVTSADQLPKLRAEVTPVQEQIDAHNATARYHKVDRALICVPISLRADPIAIAEVCRQIGDELKVALAFFTLEERTEGPPAIHGGADCAATWKAPVDNWLVRTKNLGRLFPTLTGQMITEAIESVRDLRKKVVDLAKASEKAGQLPESALRTAIETVIAVPGATGLIENAIGFTAITDSEAKAENEAVRAEGASVEIH